MSATYEQAADDMLAVFRDAWAPTGWPVDYPNIKPDTTIPPDTPIPWARVNIVHGSGGQTALAGADGSRRFDRGGVLIAQIFVPTGEGAARSQQLQKLVSDAYEGQATPRHIWFRNVRVNEVGPSDGWWQVNVIAEFTYDEIK